MPRLFRVATRGVREILGSVEPSSPNPRRNTSKDFFEVLRRGNKTATCCSFVADLLRLAPIRSNHVATIMQHVAMGVVPNLNGDLTYRGW
jgi:hypothetical protein